MEFPKWIIEIATLGMHKNKSVIWLPFNYDADKIATVKAMHGKFSQSQKCWYLPDVNTIRKALNLPLPFSVGKQVFDKIHPVNQPVLQQLYEMLTLKGYSEGTKRTYLLELAQLLYIIGKIPVAQLSPEKIRSYLFYCHDELKLSENQIHSRINAIKFYFEQVLGNEKIFVSIPRPKKPSSLPKVLNQKEILRLFAACDNTKHQLMLQLCYGMGLRVSEVVALRISDIDSSRMQVLVANAKGKKDRYVQLPQSVLEALRTYYLHYHPKDFLFEGQYGGQYSVRSVQAVFKSTMRKAGIRKPVGIHSLRHSYATHLHEYGTDIGFIQKLLGDNDLKQL